MKNILIVGCGFMGKTHGTAHKNNGNANIFAAEADKDCADAYAKEYNCPVYPNMSEALKNEDIDIIDICLPTFLHEEHALEALASGKHVILEKPMTLSLESAERIIAAAKGSKGMFMVAQALRFWPEYAKTKEFMDDGVLGDISYMNAKRLAQHPNWSPWFRDPSRSGGGLFDLMMHDVDYANHLFGLATTAYAVGHKNEIGAWNDVTASFEFSCGAYAVIESQFNMTNGYPFSMDLRVMGDKGTIDFKFSAGFNLEDRDSAINSFVLYTAGGDPEQPEFEHPDAYEVELKYFVDCVEKGEKPTTITPDSSLNSMRMIDAVLRSLESGEKIIL